MIAQPLFLFGIHPFSVAAYVVVFGLGCFMLGATSVRVIREARELRRREAQFLRTHGGRK